MGIVAVFTSDTALITYTNKSMRVYLAMLFIYGIQVACQYSFVALDQAPKAIFLTIWRKDYYTDTIDFYFTTFYARFSNGGISG